MEPLKLGRGTVPSPSLVGHSLGLLPQAVASLTHPLGWQKCFYIPWWKVLKKHWGCELFSSCLCKSAMADICLLFFAVLE